MHATCTNRADVHEQNVAVSESAWKATRCLILIKQVLAQLVSRAYALNDNLERVLSVTCSFIASALPLLRILREKRQYGFFAFYDLFKPGRKYDCHDNIIAPT